MPENARLPVVVVAGLHGGQRRRAVDELLNGRAGAVVLHHDLGDAPRGIVRRELRDARGR
ncbi:hypothetical protein ABT247_10625 [Kitasatospora sp. NPDC001539]|uniref:hypothetical protein n=1 Tax=Kitasatospora sp. NPDC001539 TaxID=3154384 RepID=UPI0033173091